MTDAKSVYFSALLNGLKKNEKLVYFSGLFILFITIGIEQLLGFCWTDNFLQHIPHSFWKNVFLINYTFMGDSVFVLSIIALMLYHWKKKELAKQLFLSFLTTAIVTQLLKNYFLSENFTVYVEPGSVSFSDSEETYLPFFNPSMHTAMAFMMATCLIMKFRLSAISQLSILFTAVGIACSRVYLAQHSVLELWVGALTGTLSAWLAYWVGFSFSDKSFLNLLQRNSKKENAAQVLPA